MPKFKFDPRTLKQGFAIGSLVPPTSPDGKAGDYVLKIVEGVLCVFSPGKRSFVRAEIHPTFAEDPSFSSEDEFYLPVDRKSLFDSDLTEVGINVSEKGLVVKADGDGQSRQAVVKKKMGNSRRASMPKRFSITGESMSSRNLEELLHQVSCSALARETKSEEDMKVNQVHFYPEIGSVYSNARDKYVSIATLDGMKLTHSIVSADLPTMRAFCSKIDGDVVVGQDKGHLFIQDPKTGSIIGFSRIACNKPPLTVFSQDDYEIVMTADHTQLTKALKWASMAVEATPRVTWESDGQELRMLHGGNEVATMPIEFTRGSTIKADFHADNLLNIVSHVDGKVTLKYKHKSAPALLEITGSTKGVVSARHFILSMKERK